MLNPSVSLSQPVFDVYAPRLLTGRAGVIYMWRRGDTAITFPIQITMILLMSMLGRLPMRWFERAGNIFGGVVYLFSRRDARRLRENLRAAGVAANEREYRKLLYEAIGQTGKTAAEWVKVWFGAEVEIERLIVECKGWPSVEEARRDRKAIIFLMPHLGSFQLAMRFIAQRMPLTALYRPPQVRWLEPLMMAGSQRAKLSLAPTNLKGVERLIQALRRGEAVALPPDQAPNSRGGVWAEFFGRPAYTTTLPRKLQRATGAVMFTAFAAACRAVKAFASRSNRCRAIVSTSARSIESSKRSCAVAPASSCGVTTATKFRGKRAN